jgi:hypothetical protein
LVATKDRRAVNKHRSHRFNLGRSNIKKLKIEGKEQYHVEIANEFATLEDLVAEVDINSVWETI